MTSSGLKPDPDKVGAIQKMRDLKISRECDEYVYSSPLGHISAQIVRHHGLTTTTDAQGSRLALDQRPQRSVPRYPKTGHSARLFRGSINLVTSAFWRAGKRPQGPGNEVELHDLTEQLTLQCRTSERGFGAALLQHGAPHAFPSRALTAAETRDAQNEKVMQAVVNASSRSVSRTTSRYSPP